MSKYIAIIIFFASVKVFGQEYFLSSVDGTKLFVREFGMGEPILLLSGGPGLNADYLKPVWEELSKNFRCIVLDQRGTGRSVVSSVDSVSMSMNNYINDISVLQEHLNLKSVPIVGHSWGGMLAMEYAANKPDKVSSLILVGPGGPTKNFYSYLSDNILMRLNESDLKEMALLDSLNIPNLQAIWPGYFYDRKMGIKSRAEMDFEDIWGQPRVLNYTVSNYISRDTQRISLLNNFDGEAIIIQGRQDPVGESTVYEILKLLPQAQINFIEQCGHFPWLEKPEQTEKFYNVLNDALN